MILVSWRMMREYVLHLGILQGAGMPLRTVILITARHGMKRNFIEVGSERGFHRQHVKMLATLQDPPIDVYEM